MSLVNLNGSSDITARSKPAVPRRLGKISQLITRDGYCNVDKALRALRSAYQYARCENKSSANHHLEGSP